MDTVQGIDKNTNTVVKHEGEQILFSSFNLADSKSEKNAVNH